MESFCYSCSSSFLSLTDCWKCQCKNCKQTLHNLLHSSPRKGGRINSKATHFSSVLVLVLCFNGMSGTRG